MKYSISNNGLDLIKRFEGFRNAPYKCPANYPTIGYGIIRYPSTGKKVSMNDRPITLEEGEVMLRQMVKQFEDAVNNDVTSNINQNQYDALVSFTYNLGTTNFRRSTLLKKVNANPNDKNISYQFSRWNKASGRVLKGLTRRRNSEAYHYFTPITDYPNSLS